MSINRQPTPWMLALILGLLALRYSVTAARILLGEPPEWFIPAFDIANYFLIALFLIMRRNSLAGVQISALALWGIILFKPILTLIQALYQFLDPSFTFILAFPKFPGLVLWGIAGALFFVFRSQLLSKGAIQRQDWKAVGMGLLVGLGLVLITAYPGSFTVGSPNPVSKSTILASMLQGAATIPYQLGYAAVTEEPVFRGFLWGYLRKTGWRDVWIWLFQAALFTLAHLYYVKSAPLMFWFSVPVGGLALGWLAWRSRTITTSMTAHGVVNGLSRTMEFVFAALRG